MKTLCSFNTPEEYEELKLEIFTERKISTEAVADIKLTEEEIQAIRKKTKERRQVFHSKIEKDITEWAFEEGVSYANSFPLRDDSHKCHLVFTDQTTLLSCEATRASLVLKRRKFSVSVISTV